jgi:hypothetical protein
VLLLFDSNSCGSPCAVRSAGDPYLAWGDQALR